MKFILPWMNSAGQKRHSHGLQRRKILSMSVSDEENIYIFPDDIPVNIANPADLARLKKIFSGRELYFVAGSDVIKNASCYRQPPAADSIHSMNHIIFKRSSDERRDGLAGEKAVSDHRQHHQPPSGRIL